MTRRLMASLSPVLLVAVAGAAGHARADSGPVAHAACGVERWSVKTLTDADARRVNLVPSTTTVAKLRRLAAPSTLPDRRLPAEFRSYRIHARLVAYKLEDDGDVHLVVADPASGGRMIVEFPNSGCTHGAPSTDRHKIAVAKRALLAACGPPSSRFTTLHGTATISGVLFFDFKHGQRGVAPNAVELHPVVGFASGDCGVG
jgi:hypothetical protein